jgi:hypothetical protein
MPWEAYARMTDNDSALYRYLKSMPPARRGEHASGQRKLVAPDGSVMTMDRSRRAAQLGLCGLAPPGLLIPAYRLQGVPWWQAISSGVLYVLTGGGLGALVWWTLASVAGVVGVDPPLRCTCCSRSRSARVTLRVSAALCSCFAGKHTRVPAAGRRVANGVGLMIYGALALSVRAQMRLREQELAAAGPSSWPCARNSTRTSSSTRCTR